MRPECDLYRSGSRTSYFWHRCWPQLYFVMESWPCENFTAYIGYFKVTWNSVAVIPYKIQRTTAAPEAQDFLVLVKFYIPFLFWGSRYLNQRLTIAFLFGIFLVLMFSSYKSFFVSVCMLLIWQITGKKRNLPYYHILETPFITPGCFWYWHF